MNDDSVETTGSENEPRRTDPSHSEDPVTSEAGIRMPPGGPTVDVDASFRRALKWRRQKRSTAGRARRIRAATREVEFELSEWEHSTGHSVRSERARLFILSKAENLRSDGIAGVLLRFLGVLRGIR